MKKILISFLVLLFVLISFVAYAQTKQEVVQGIRLFAHKYYNGWSPIIAITGKNKNILLIQSVHVNTGNVFQIIDTFNVYIVKAKIKKVVFIRHIYNENEWSGWEWDACILKTERGGKGCALLVY